MGPKTWKLKALWIIFGIDSVTSSRKDAFNIDGTTLENDVFHVYSLLITGETKGTETWYIWFRISEIWELERTRLKMI